MGAVTFVAPDADPIAETTRAIFLRALEQHEYGVGVSCVCSPLQPVRCASRNRSLRDELPDRGTRGIIR